MFWPEWGWKMEWQRRHWTRSILSLATPHGIVILQPPYSKYYLYLGEISSYPPGYKENAGIFCHNNPWVMIAEARLGNGDRAMDYYMRINPSVREELADLHRCEPYVYAQMIAGAMRQLMAKRRTHGSPVPRLGIMSRSRNGFSVSVLNMMVCELTRVFRQRGMDSKRSAVFGASDTKSMSSAEEPEMKSR